MTKTEFEKCKLVKMDDLEEFKKSIEDEIQKEKEYKREVKCVEDGFFSFNGEDLYLIKILTIIKKTEKNVK